MTDSPTFCATFADGIQTRMTTHTSLSKLDLSRGIVLARMPTGRGPNTKKSRRRSPRRTSNSKARC